MCNEQWFRTTINCIVYRLYCCIWCNPILFEKFLIVLTGTEIFYLVTYIVEYKEWLMPQAMVYCHALFCCFYFDISKIFLVKVVLNFCLL